MKKFLTLIAILAFTSTFAQNTFQVWHFNAKQGMQSDIVDLTKERWNDAKFKSGGIQVEAIKHGDNQWSHRIILFGEIGKIGRVEGDQEKYERSYFRKKINDYVDEWGPSAAGRFLGFVGNPELTAYPYIQIYDLDLDDPVAFQKAHDKLLKSTAKDRADRPIAFGTYDIGGNGSSHWVAIGSSNFNDLMDQKVIGEKNVKAWAEWNKTNGGLESNKNFTIEVLAAFGSL